MKRTSFLPALFLLPFALSGCGGSSSSSSTAYNGTDKTATISNPIAPLQPKGYSINIAPSGAATYTVTAVVGYSQGQLQYSTQTGNGAIPAGITAKFFQDLAAAVPVSKLPVYTGARAVGGGSLSLTYQAQTGPIDNLADSREAALLADNDAITKALGVSLSPVAP